MKLPPQLAKYSGAAIFGASIFTVLIALPSVMFNFKPVGRFEAKENVLADNKTGEMYSWVDFGDGQVRFVKLDRHPEGEVRKGLSPRQEQGTSDEASSTDVRSGRIFEKQGAISVGDTKYLVDTKVKYRGREDSMLYRVAISATPPVDATTGKPGKCVTARQSTALKSIYASEGSNMTIRFEDSDRFWVKDVIVPLFAGASNNGFSTIVDGSVDSCGLMSQVVFHGRADLSLPDYTWVDNGKLILGSVKIATKGQDTAKTQQPKGD
jgi:hypothetical protein